MFPAPSATPLPEYAAPFPVHFPVVSALGHDGEPLGATVSLVSTKDVLFAR